MSLTTNRYLRTMESMNQFLSEANLYEIHTTAGLDSSLLNQIITPFYFQGKTFDYVCQRENNKMTSFVLELQNHFELRQEFEGCRAGVSDQCIIDGKLNYTIHIVGTCQSCRHYHVDFMINIYSKDPVPSAFIEFSNHPSAPEQSGLSIPIFIQKVGASPERKVSPNNIVIKFLDRESGNWYYKGISSIKDNYGIGALAYFRRIIEKELIHIIEEIKDLPDAHTLDIQSLLDEHNKQPAVTTIYENIFQHLPNSLKSLGENPIKLLYNQTSEGLHSMTETDAMEKAKGIQQLLEFVIVKINEEKSNIKSLKDTIRALKR